MVMQTSISSEDAQSFEQATEKEFWRRYNDESPEAATNWLYRMSQDKGFVLPLDKTIALQWRYASSYGSMIMTINAAKPEKDPRSIAAAAKSNATTCPFCKGSDAYTRHLRVLMEVHNSPWTLHFSPYGYFNEHCIVAAPDHSPMKMGRGTFADLLDLCDMFPHYFFGSNADLPIVGGSILGHNHYQGGRFEFPLDKASVVKTYQVRDESWVDIGVVKWPLSVLRLTSTDKDAVIDVATRVFDAWHVYSNSKLGIVAQSEDGTSHNTITPIARKIDGVYRLDLALRCNVTSDDHPLGVFHPHEEVHKVKKENIGLIEVMGLGILPPRVSAQFKINDETDRDRIVVGGLFVEGLAHCGVFPQGEEGMAACQAFLVQLGAM